MKYLSYAIIVVVFMLIAGCQGGSLDITRSGSEATCIQDVLNAWNDNCVDYNFNTGNLVDTVTVGGLYYGSDFSTDFAGLALAMQNQLLSAAIDNPVDIDDLLTAVLEDDCWY